LRREPRPLAIEQRLKNPVTATARIRVAATLTLEALELITRVPVEANSREDVKVMFLTAWRWNLMREWKYSS
jgi:hypothetical protein